ncbi:MAG: polysaccharide biosynthesis protein [Clostridia bacterium]|nr:polysaccharide biosynthesis protein [Clostridia bacterium]
MVILSRVLPFLLASIIFKAQKEIDSGLVSIARCLLAVISAGVFSWTVLYFTLLEYSINILVVLTMELITIVVLYLTRALYVFYIHEYKKNLEKSIKIPAMIVGAGAATKMLLSEMESRDSKYYPECLIDDDPEKLGTKLMGIPIAGTVDDIPRLAEDKNINTIIISIPSASIEDMNRITEKCVSTSCFIRTLPSVSEIIEHNGKCLTSMKNIPMEDLLGREPISIDTEEVSEMVKNKVCMVTGGGGSIGSELCRQIMSYWPQRLIIVDIYENNAYEIQQELRSRYGANIPLTVEIASVRDYAKMDALMKKYKPNLVFHAAAHKHVPLMEYSAEEAVKNNVFGTYNMAKLAKEHSVDRFLLISTDKAVNPTNVMGASKRCCEMVIKYFSNMESNTTYVTVRFGNVLGSNGSVVPLFEKQIEKGGPITITHPDICRYFMTIPEAVSLVLQAETMAQSGQIFVLDMGKPVKIVTLAENLIKMFGFRPYKDIKIEFVGLREGEKLYEELRMDEEEVLPTYNSKIFIGSHIGLPDDFESKLDILKQYAENNDSEQVVKQLQIMVPTYEPDKRIH